MIYVGLPVIMLSKAKGRWADTERKLNDAFWSMYDSDVIAEMIQCLSGSDWSVELESSFRRELSRREDGRIPKKAE